MGVALHRPPQFEVAGRGSSPNLPPSEPSFSVVLKDLLHFVGDLVDVDAAVVSFLLVVAVPALEREKEEERVGGGERVRPGCPPPHYVSGTEGQAG